MKSQRLFPTAERRMSFSTAPALWLAMKRRAERSGPTLGKAVRYLLNEYTALVTRPGIKPRPKIIVL